MLRIQFKSTPVLSIALQETETILVSVVMLVEDGLIFTDEIFGPCWSAGLGQVPQTGLFELLMELLSENPLGSDENCETHQRVIFWS